MTAGLVLRAALAARHALVGHHGLVARHAHVGHHVLAAAGRRLPTAWAAGGVAVLLVILLWLAFAVRDAWASHRRGGAPIAAAVALEPTHPRLNLGCGDHLLPGFVNLDRTRGWTFESGLRDFADGSVAAITISHALMYVREQDIPFVVSECHRVLRPGGVIRITEDDTENPTSLAFGGWRGEDPFVTLTSPAIVARWLARAGFEIHEVTEDTTLFPDRSLCQSVHRGPPHVFFLEGVRPAARAAIGS